MNEQKICPLMCIAGNGGICIKGRCALACYQWNEHGDQVTCSTYVCALKVLAEALERLTSHVTDELYGKEATHHD